VRRRQGQADGRYGQRVNRAAAHAVAQAPQVVRQQDYNGQGNADRGQQAGRVEIRERHQHAEQRHAVGDAGLVDAVEQFPAAPGVRQQHPAAARGVAKMSGRQRRGGYYRYGEQQIPGENGEFWHKRAPTERQRPL